MEDSEDAKGAKSSDPKENLARVTKHAIHAGEMYSHLKGNLRSAKGVNI